MRGNELLDKMELIDATYIEAADVKKVQKRKNTWVKWGATAACLCLAAVSAFMIPGIRDIYNYPIHDSNTPGVSDSNHGDIPKQEPDSKNDTGNTAPNSVNGGVEFATEPYYGPNMGPGDNEILPGKPMISYYGESTATPGTPVAEGDVYFSESLEAAMKNYGNTENYRVLVELFRGGVQISSGGELALKESQRLADLGYIIAMETVTQPKDNGEYISARVSYYFTLHATYEQLQEFAASEAFGYSLMLYGEYFGESTSPNDMVFNGYIPSNN